MTLAEYYDACARHDWFYEYSDDPGVWRRGSDSMRALDVGASSSPEKRAIRDAWAAHHFKGGPKPERPANAE